MNRSSKIFYLILFVSVFFYFTAGKKLFNPISETEKDYQYLTLFSEVISKTKSQYFEEVDPAEKFPGAYSAMLGRLDKCSAYLDAVRTGIYELYGQGNACSAGIYGSKSANYFLISDVLKESPAEKAGLTPGDTIRAIRGKSIYGMPYYQVYVSLLTGKPGKIELSVYKKKTKKTETVTLDTVLLENKTRVIELENNISLIKIATIDKESVKDLTANLTGKKTPRFIIDLRHYAGGDLESFLDLAKMFFSQSTGWTITLKEKENEHVYPIGSKEALRYRAAVIVNKSTIMYGELLAALFEKTAQNKKSGITIIGQKTPGFISRLKQEKFIDGSSILLSTGFYLLNDQRAARAGVKPHIELDNKEFAHVIDKSAALLNED